MKILNQFLLSYQQKKPKDYILAGEFCYTFNTQILYMQFSKSNSLPKSRNSGNTSKLILRDQHYSNTKARL